MLDDIAKRAIREAFQQGTLQIKAVDPATGAVAYYQISDVLKHATGHKSLVRTTLTDGRGVTSTVDHSLFHMTGSGGVVPVQAGHLQPGDTIATVTDNRVVPATVAHVEILPPVESTYDLSVPGPENFVLTTGILAHNSYSIGGISLDLEKSSKYMDLKQNAEDQWDKLTEAKARTTKYIRGLSQPRFGQGVRSAFGPAVGKGVLSPRSFV
jgi:intein/homing endonuclease